MVEMPELLDSVALLTPVGGWPAGTTGAVVDMLSGDVLMVELVGPDGRTLDLLDVPASSLRVVERARTLA